MPSSSYSFMFHDTKWWTVYNQLISSSRNFPFSCSESSSTPVGNKKNWMVICRLNQIDLRWHRIPLNTNSCLTTSAHKHVLRYRHCRKLCWSQLHSPICWRPTVVMPIAYAGTCVTSKTRYLQNNSSKQNSIPKQRTKFLLSTTKRSQNVLCWNMIWVQKLAGSYLSRTSLTNCNIQKQRCNTIISKLARKWRVSLS
jgi:hypothetical protein